MKYRFALLAVLLFIAGTSRAGLINPGFETGDLTGWTVYDTPHGGTAEADVALFDTAGTGTPSDSARLRVGETSGTIGTGGVGEGAGIEQTINLNSGTLNITADVAIFSDAINGDGGTFELLLNGNLVDGDSFGIVGPGTERIQLHYSGTVTAGPATIAIEARRGYGIGAPDTPVQYIDNVNISGTAVPLPEAGTAGLVLSCFAGALRFRPRRRRA